MHHGPIQPYCVRRSQNQILREKQKHRNWHFTRDFCLQIMWFHLLADLNGCRYIQIIWEVRGGWYGLHQTRILCRTLSLFRVAHFEPLFQNLKCANDERKRWCFGVFWYIWDTGLKIQSACPHGHFKPCGPRQTWQMLPVSFAMAWKQAEQSSCKYTD